jgi:hypothetical protein
MARRCQPGRFAACKLNLFEGVVRRSDDPGRARPCIYGDDDMPFLTEPEPERGANLPVLPGINRIVANNPGPMTYFGTNTYLIDTPAGLAVLDPGPEGHPEHVEAILRHTGGQIAFILVSHTHHDHVGAVPALQEATGAPTVGFRNSALEAFDPRSPGCRCCTRPATRRIICVSRFRRGTVTRRCSARIM